MQAKRVVEKNRPYTALAATPEFEEWRELGPRASMDNLKKEIVSVDRTNPRWREIVCDMVIEYQGINRVFEDNFNIHARAADTARKIIQEAEKR